MIHPDKKVKILFVSLKWTDARPDRPLSSVHLLMDTLNQSGLGKAGGFFCDAHIHSHRTQCDEALLKQCWRLRPDVLFLFPSQLDITVTLEGRSTEKPGPFYLFPRNETIKYIRDKLGVPVINAVGDAWGVEAFKRFEGMAEFSDIILLFEPQSDFLTMTKTPSKYSKLWFPINQKRFDRNGYGRDIPVSFIGRTHCPSGDGTVSVDSPLHQYVYRNHFLQKIIGMGIPVFRAGGAQNVYPLSDGMVSQYIQRSEITLNFSYHSPNKRLFRGRVWEALSCGTMLLEEDNASIRHFLEPMKHYVPFSGIRDAVEKMRFYLSNKAERKTIAQQGYRMARTRFSDTAFWSECLRLIYT
jgi:hypothetical protein